MTKFRKKPVVIEATQWFKNGDHPRDYAKSVEGFENGHLVVFSGAECKANGWEGQIVRYYRNPEDDGARGCSHCGQIMHVHGWIDTLEGGHNVCPGDWIITGVKGEHYPCKPDIFTATYEDVVELGDLLSLPVISPIEEAAKALVEALNARNFKFEDTTTHVEIDGGETVDVVPEFLFHALCKAVRDAGI